MSVVVVSVPIKIEEGGGCQGAVYLAKGFVKTVAGGIGKSGK